MLFLILTAIAASVSILSGGITLYDRARLGSKSQQTKFAFGVTLATIVLTFVFLFASVQSLQANSTGSNPTPTTSTFKQVPSVTPDPTQATPTPTTVIATPSPAATLPCIVNVSAWPNESSWAVHDGSLYNDGTQNTTITAPCHIGTSNYAVEAKIQVTKQNCCYVSSTFGIFFSRAPGQNGSGMYTMGVGGESSQCPNSAYISDTTNDICSNQLAAEPFSIGTSMHTYRVEVKDNTIRFFIDGGLVCTTTDNRLLTTQGDQAVGLYDSGNQLQVSSFEVTALS